MKSVDGSCITSFFVHECDSSTRMGSRPRRFLFTGHQNGSVQVRYQQYSFDLKHMEVIGSQYSPACRSICLL